MTRNIFHNSSLADGQITFSVVDGEPYVQVGADAARPFKSGYSNVKVVASTDSTSQQTVSVLSDTYGEDFIVLLEIFAYNSNFSKSISVSGDITYETLLDGHNLYTNAVSPYFYVLKVKGKGSLTITYTTYDGNIHAGRVTVLY